LFAAPDAPHFNVRMIGEDRYGQGDGSFGAHNPLLTATLLTNSINALKAQYPYLPVPPAVQALVDRTMQRVAQARAAQAGNR
jgi:hypothetical protein